MDSIAFTESQPKHATLLQSNEAFRAKLLFNPSLWLLTDLSAHFSCRYTETRVKNGTKRFGRITAQSRQWGPGMSVIQNLQRFFHIIAELEMT